MAALALLLSTLAGEPAVIVTTAAGENLTGRVVLAGAAGGLLLETPDQTLHAIAAAKVAATESAGRFAYLDGTALAERLAANLGEGVAVRLTPHFAIASTASAADTAAAADLLEQVRRDFLTEFAVGPPLREPPHRLPVVILKDRAAFDAYVARTARPGAFVPRGSPAYYDPVTNVVALSAAGPDHAVTMNLAHEATHQLAANTGLDGRLADTPAAVREGLATLAETADRRRPGSWRGFGGRNAVRRANFAVFLRDRRRDPNLRNTNPLPALIGADDLFRDPATATAAYAAAWKLIDHLHRTRPAALLAYLAGRAAAPPFIVRTPEDRLVEFRRHFGDLDTLWRAIVR